MTRRIFRPTFATRQRRAAVEQEQRRNVERGKWMYDSPWWKATRAERLQRNPTCACGKPNTVVDHRTPHRGDPRLFFSDANLQESCATCHNRKTATTEVRHRFGA